MKRLLLYFLIIVIVALIMSSCASQREGCWKGPEPKFRYDSKKMRA